MLASQDGDLTWRTLWAETPVVFETHHMSNEWSLVGLSGITLARWLAHPGLRTLVQ